MALVARNEKKLKAEVAHLKGAGIDAMYVVGDAGSEASLNDALNEIRGAYSHADTILYNAYAPSFKRLELETWESIQAQMAVNVDGAFNLLKKVLPFCKEQNKGKLFFTGGGLSLYPQPNLVGLSMGKTALRNLVVGTAEGLKGTGVHVATVTVCGFVKENDPKYNPAAIAEQYWALFNQQSGEFVTEVVY